MEVQLTELLLKTAGAAASELRAFAWQVYEETYLNVPGKPIGIHQAHDDQAVVFHATTFENAFFKAGDPVNHPKEKDVLDLTRVQRLKWIAPIIAGQVPGTTCWEVLMPGFPHAKRLYVQHEHSYMIWLEPRIDTTRGPWRFATAYLASPKQIMSKTQMGKLILDLRQKPAALPDAS
jgi:hypothetical protein